uniref:DUF2069 domain-containing protein n=1 Tax=Thaumasiovibrio occultus TaxID=1891184 RepID=UPI000B361B98|nr:DUF2069 domain-containing protein [Thaumasiovibrio occultus]
MSTQHYRILALASYLLLIGWLIAWQNWLSPHPHISALGVTIGWLIPLLFPLLGIIKGKAYTHAWANFIVLFYILHALTILWVDQGERGLAAVELLIALSSFATNIMYARKRGREIGSKLKKLSQVEKEEKARFAPDAIDDAKAKSE